jgi:hypothetical protein
MTSTNQPIQPVDLDQARRTAAAAALRWAADRIDPGPAANRKIDDTDPYSYVLAADRGTAHNLRFWADQVERDATFAAYVTA